MLRLRVLSALLGVPLLLLLPVVGGGWYVAAVVGGAILAAFELFSMLGGAGFRPIVPLGILLTVGLVLAALPGDGRLLPAMLVLAMALSAFILMGRENTTNALVDWAFTLAPALYVGGTMHYFVALRILPDGMLWMLLVLTCTWACDTAAFFVGRRWGKARLAPRISPGKSVEGAIGGLVGAILAALIFGPLLIWIVNAAGWSDIEPVSLVRLAGLGLVISITAVAGDLLESFIKRQCGAKDSGTLIPGHGGVLDRIDSVMLAAVGAYFFVVTTS